MPNWEQMFVPDLSIAETFLRASAVYLALLILFRLVLKRQTGSIGLPDVLLVVLVSECVSASLSAEAKSIPNGLIAVFALLFWNYILDWLAFRWSWLGRRLMPEPLQLIQDGRRLRDNMAAEDVTDDELMAQLRMNGLDDIGQVKSAFIESEGMISVVPRVDVKPTSKPSLARPEASGKQPDFEFALEQLLKAADNFRASLVIRSGEPQA